MHEVFFYGLKPHISCYILLYHGAPLGEKKVDEREKTNAVSSPLAKDFLNVSLIPEQEYTKPQLETLVLFPLHAGVDMQTLTVSFFYSTTIHPTIQILPRMRVLLLLQRVSGRTVIITYRIMWLFFEKGSLNVYWAPVAHKKIWPHLGRYKTSAFSGSTDGN